MKELFFKALYIIELKAQKCSLLSQKPDLLNLENALKYNLLSVSQIHLLKFSAWFRKILIVAKCFGLLGQFSGIVKQMCSAEFRKHHF